MHIPSSSPASSSRAAKGLPGASESGPATEAAHPIFVRGRPAGTRNSPDRMDAPPGGPVVPGRFSTGAMHRIESAASGMGPQSSVPSFFRWQPSAGGAERFGMMSQSNGHMVLSGLEGEGPFVRFQNGQPSAAEVSNRQELSDVLRGAQRALPPLRSRL